MGEVLTTVLVAPAAWKGTFTPRQAAAAIATGVRRALPDAAIESLPISDGGDGLLDVLLAPAGRRDAVVVSGPLGRPVSAPLGWLDESTVVIESASACGLRLLGRGERDPLRATTRGVGEMVRAAVDRGARVVAVGLGGSATVDGGSGLARALGWRLLDRDGRDLLDGGGTLSRLTEVVPGPPVAAAIVALTDVATPLTGPEGAAPVFAPQKGAGADAVLLLAAGLERLADVMGRRGAAGVEAAAGAGAAGGLGAGLVWFAGATLVPGAPWVFDRIGFDAALGRADLVITAEGRFDRTSLAGKATGEVVRRARAHGVRVVVLAARADRGLDVPVRDAPGGVVDAPALSDLAAGSVVGL